MSILRGVNLVLAKIDGDSVVSEIQVDFLSKDCSLHLNVHFLNIGVHEMLDGNDCLAVDMTSIIICAYIDHATRFKIDSIMTGVHRMYYRILPKAVSQNYDRGRSVAELEQFCRVVFSFKHKVEITFLAAYTSGICTLKVHLLDHRIKNISSFWGITVLEASPYKQFKTSIKSAYRNTSQRHATPMDWIVFGCDQMQSKAPRVSKY